MVQTNLANLSSFDLPLLLIFKIFILAFLLMYLLFSLAVLRQVSIMNKVVETEGEGFIFFLAQLHVAAAGVVFAAVLLLF